MNNKSSKDIGYHTINMELDILNKITKVEPPAFLYTRIQEKIQAARENTISSKWVYSIAASVIFLLFLNINMIKEMQENSKNELVVQDASFMKNVNFYYE
jgi:hypothetical protein